MKPRPFLIWKEDFDLKEEYILQMQDIVKNFPGVKALDGVRLNIKKGSVHALLGENGAGKSTLMKILTGNLQPDSGRIFFDGKEVSYKNPIEAIRSGISMIHQELSPLLDSSIADNIFLGREPMKKGSVDYGYMYKETYQLLNLVQETQLSPKQHMRTLSIAQMQLIEIAKAVYSDAKLIVMDEPTSALTEDETEKLFNIISDLKSKGVSIIYITHRMKEVFTICDELTVFRDGKYIDEMAVQNATIDELIRLMIGRELGQLFPEPITVQGKEVVLETKNLTLEKVFQNINIHLHKGEVIGFAGLVGAGRTEVIETIFGLRKKTSGEIWVNQKLAKISSPIDAIKYKIGLITEDRQLSGLFQPLSVGDNMSVVSLDNYMRAGQINYSKVRAACNRMVSSMRIKAPGLNTIISSLSGGNQQKCIIGRWLLADCDILMLDEPTRGIDVGAKGEIYKLIMELTAQGKSVIFVSSELQEVIGVCDRIYVMHEGVLTGEISRDDANQEILMRYATKTATNE